MNMFKKLFRISSEKSNKSSEKKEVLIKKSSENNENLPSNKEILNESQMSAFCSIGNLIFEKKYHEAIELGNKLLENSPHSAGIHINLMDAYFKVRNENPDYYEKSIEHARLAMLYGHNTGYAQERLIINLEKLGKIKQAIQVCDIVLIDQFHFSEHGCGVKEEFAKRKEKLLKKLNKETNKENIELFTDKDISFLIEQIRMEDEKAIKEKVEHEKRMKQLENEISKNMNP